MSADVKAACRMLMKLTHGFHKCSSIAGSRAEARTLCRPNDYALPHLTLNLILSQIKVALDYKEMTFVNPRCRRDACGCGRPMERQILVDRIILIL